LIKLFYSNYFFLPACASTADRSTFSFPLNPPYQRGAGGLWELGGCLKEKVGRKVWLVIDDFYDIIPMMSDE
jgi:hypothetical protein